VLEHPSRSDGDRPIAIDGDRRRRHRMAHDARGEPPRRAVFVAAQQTRHEAGASLGLRLLLGEHAGFGDDACDPSVGVDHGHCGDRVRTVPGPRPSARSPASPWRRRHSSRLRLSSNVPFGSGRGSSAKGERPMHGTLVVERASGNRCRRASRG
jgi:hypothetical protein